MNKRTNRFRLITEHCIATDKYNLLRGNDNCIYYYFKKLYLRIKLNIQGESKQHTLLYNSNNNTITKSLLIQALFLFLVYTHQQQIIYSYNLFNTIVIKSIINIAKYA